MSLSVRHILFRLFPNRRWTLYVPTFRSFGIQTFYQTGTPGQHSVTGGVVLSWVYPWLRKKMGCKWWVGTMGINRSRFNTLKEVYQYWGPEYDAAMAKWEAKCLPHKEGK